jgi:hypothetical protein
MPSNPEYLNQKFTEAEQNEAEHASQKAFSSDDPGFIRNQLEYKLKRRHERQQNILDPRHEIPADVAGKFDHQQICCRSKRYGEIYLSASGLVWPCCFLSVNEWGMGPMQFQLDEIFRNIDGGMDSLNFRKHSLPEILQSDFFQKQLPESWAKSSLNDGKLYDCAYWCPKEKSHFASEYEGAHV